MSLDLLTENARLRLENADLREALARYERPGEELGTEAARMRLGFPSDPEATRALLAICSGVCGLDDCAGGAPCLP